MINVCEEEEPVDTDAVKKNIANVKQELAKMEAFLGSQVYKRCGTCY